MADNNNNLNPILTNSIVISYDMVMTKRKLKKFLSNFDLQAKIKRCPRSNSDEFDTVITATGVLSQLVQLERDKFAQNVLKIPLTLVNLKTTPSETFVSKGVVIEDTLTSFRRENLSGNLFFIVKFMFF